MLFFSLPYIFKPRKYVLLENIIISQSNETQLKNPLLGFKSVQETIKQLNTKMYTGCI